MNNQESYAASGQSPRGGTPMRRELELSQEESVPDDRLLASSCHLPREHVYDAEDVVPESGIYEVVHHPDHREPGTMALVRGDFFPHCQICGALVHYRAVRIASYIFHDRDFPKQE